MHFFISPKSYLKEARINKERASSLLEIEYDDFYSATEQNLPFEKLALLAATPCKIPIYNQSNLLLTSSIGILKLIQYLFQIVDHLLPTTPRLYGQAFFVANVHPIATTFLSQPQRVGQQFLTEGVNAHSHFSQ